MIVGGLQSFSGDRCETSKAAASGRIGPFIETKGRLSDKLGPPSKCLELEILTSPPPTGENTRFEFRGPMLTTARASILI